MLLFIFNYNNYIECNRYIKRTLGIRFVQSACAADSVHVAPEHARPSHPVAPAIYKPTPYQYNPLPVVCYRNRHSRRNPVSIKIFFPQKSPRKWIRIFDNTVHNRAKTDVVCIKKHTVKRAKLCIQLIYYFFFFFSGSRQIRSKRAN